MRAFIIVVLTIYMAFNINVVALAQDETSYNYNDIEQVIEENGYGQELDFESLVKDITGESYSKDGNSSNNLLGGFLGKLVDTVVDELAGNKNVIMTIILLAVMSAAVDAFIPMEQSKQITGTSMMVIEIALITIVSASFFNAADSCTKIISVCVDLYKAIIPVFFTAVFAVTGSATVAAYYDVILMLITVVNSFFKNIFVSVIKIYFILALCDLAVGKKQFTKMGELMISIVRIGCKTTTGIFTGLGGLKGVISPVKDIAKRNVVVKGLGLVPVVGGALDTASGTIMGAGKVIKNGIGMAGVIVVVTICLVPVIKLVAMSLMYKFLAAIIEPVAGKGVVTILNKTSIAIGMLAVINIAVVTMFILMIAIICIATNV